MHYTICYDKNMAQPRYTTVITDDQPIVYTDSQPGARVTTLVAVHGFRGTDEGLEAVLEPFFDNTHLRIMTFNIPGMGYSPALPTIDYTLDTIAAQVIDFVEHIDCPKPIILLGHSFGTTVVARVASLRPDLLLQLFLISPIPLADGRRKAPHRRAALAALDAYFYLVGHGPKRLGVALFGNKLFSDFSTDLLLKKPSERQRIRDLHRANLVLPVNRRAMFQTHKASTRHDVLETALDITTPTVIIAGDRDTLAHRKHLARLAEAIPHSTYHAISGAGHLAHHEHTSELTRLIRENLGVQHD